MAFGSLPFGLMVDPGAPTVTGLSGSLGLPTTAEGIESSGNADILRDLGCTLGQGVSGLSTLALGAALTTAAIIAGASATMKLQYWLLTRAP